MNKPTVQLSGTDGNVFAIIGTMSRQLEKAWQPEQAKEFTQKAMNCGSYDEVLRLCFDYAEVK